MGFLQVVLYLVLFHKIILRRVYALDVLETVNDYVFIEETKSYYKFHPEHRSWQEAVDACAAENAILFYPTNKCEADAVIDRWRETSSYGWAFIGISKLNNSEFETIDGTAIFEVYNNWRLGEPNNKNGEENCVILLRDGTLNDVGCNKRFPSICKRTDFNSKEAVCNQVTNVESRISNNQQDYTYLEDTKSYYKIHTVFLNWTEAVIKCDKEDARLFYPKNDCEANAVLEYWNLTQNFDNVYVGVSNSITGSFQSVDGHNIWEIFNIWNIYNANNNSINDMCIVLLRQGVYDLRRCDVRRPFICKKTDDYRNAEIAVCDNSELVEVFDKEFRSDYMFLEDTHSFYKMHTKALSYNDAKVKCESENATLFVPDNECEVNTVLQFWYQTPSVSSIYIGLHSNSSVTGSSSNYVSVDGRPIWKFYNKWGPGEPNYINGEKNCVVLLQDGTFKGCKCEDTNPFICKKAAADTTKDVFCYDPKQYNNMKTQNYKYLKQVHGYYKMYGTFKSWKEAKQICENEGTSLFYPETEYETGKILDFWSETFPTRRIFVGISSFNAGLFETIHGASAGRVYSKWRPGEPNGVNGTENCVVMYRDDGAMADEQCNSKLGFICKKKLKQLNNIYGCRGKDYKKIITSVQNDYTYLEDTESLYKIHSVAYIWQTARDICRSEGADLFYPESECELKAVIDHWDQNAFLVINSVTTGRSRNDAIIITEDHGNQGSDLDVRFSDLDPVRKDRCVGLSRNGTYSYIDCFSKSYFICKKRINLDNKDYFCYRPETVSDKSGILQNDYFFLNETQSSYKLHTKARNWQNAKLLCIKEGATLFYPNNACEAKEVLNFWSKIRSYGWIFMGVTSSFDGMFQTVDSTTLWDLYYHWRSGEPNSVNHEDNCVVLSIDGSLSDIDCMKMLPFLCKKVNDKNKGESICDQLQKEIKPDTIFRPDYTFINRAGSSYKIHTMKQSWQEAQRVCAREGAELFSPENKCEASAVLELWNQTQVFSVAFIGISYFKGLLEVVGNNSIWDVYYNWRAGQPNNFQGQYECTSFMSDGTLSLSQCSTPQPFICKKKIYYNAETTVCNQSEDGKLDERILDAYIYLNNTKNFYKFHSEPVNWDSASQICKQENASFFYPANECEAEAIMNLWSQYQSIFWVFIGISSPTEGVFKTIDDKSILDVYNNWHPAEPNNAGGKESCVVFSRDGTLRDVNCDRAFPFFCRENRDANGKAICDISTSKTETIKGISFRSDYRYIEETQSFYKIHTIQQSLHKAEEICRNEGATLFYPQNKCETNVVLEFWNLTQPFKSVHIGTTEDTAVVDERFRKPTNQNHNNCTVLKYDGTFRNICCNMKAPFICKKKIGDISDCHDVDKSEDYTYVQNTENLYKLHRNFETWSNANKTCKKEGGTLFYPLNECEAKAVLQFWNQTKPFDWIFLGISSVTKGLFKTIDGRNIWEVHYNWRQRQPDNQGNNEDCVAMFLTDGLYEDVQCNKKGPFICKKEMPSKKGTVVCDEPKTYNEQINFYLRDYTYKEDVQNLYKIHTIFENWNNARKVCKEEGAVLFYPESELEFKAVQEFWRTKQDYDKILVDLTITKEGIFIVDKEELLDMNDNTLISYKPMNASRNSGCVLLSQTGNLVPESCEANHPFICKKTLKALGWNLFCNTADMSYRYNKGQGKCYKYHLRPYDYSDAYKTCISEQSSLAVVNSKNEEDVFGRVVYEPLPTALNQTLDELSFSVVHMCFHNWNGKGWQTITILNNKNEKFAFLERPYETFTVSFGDTPIPGALHEGFHQPRKPERNVAGKTLYEAGFNTWSHRPTDDGDLESCQYKLGTIYSTRLELLGCTSECYFICQRNAYNL